MPNIFNYLDYRKFLEDFFLARKGENPRFSYRIFADKAGIKNQGLYIDVVKGRKNLSDNAAKKMIIGLGLADEQARYFKYLVKYNQSNDDNKELFLKRLTGILAKSHFSTVAGNQRKYYEKWYFPVVRQIVALGQFNGDCGKLASTIFPRITYTQAKEAVKVLTELDLITRENGSWKVKKEMKMRPDTRELKEYIKALHKRWIEHGAKAVNGFTPEERYISSLMLAVAPEKLPGIYEKFENFKEDILSEHGVSAESGTEEDLRIYQFNFQLFPRNKKNPNRKKKQ